MALTFPNPAVDPEYIAPNGITYVWDDTDEKWRVKAFRSQDDVLVIVGETPPDKPKAGDLWWDSADDSLTLFVYEGTAWVPAAPPVSLDGINATIDAALLVQEDLTARVAVGETIQSDLQDVVSTALDTQTTLQNRVEALEGTVIDGKWALDNRSIAREGHFIPFTGATASIAWAGTDNLQIHPTSADGQSYTFAEISVSDVIRIGAPGSSAVFRCLTNAQSSGDVYNIGVELLNSDGVPFETLEYSFEFLNAFDPSAYATISYVDAQDDLDLKLAVANEVTTGFRIKSNGNTLISTAVAGELALYHLKDPTSGNAEWAATKGYVDTQISGIPEPDLSSYLGNEGTQDLNKNSWKLRQPNQENNNRTFIDIYDGSMNLYNVADPTSGADGWAVNKKYVNDNFISTSGTQTLNENKWNILQPDSNGDNKNFIVIEDGSLNLFHVADPTNGDDQWAANKKYVNDVAAEYLPLTGGNLTGDVETTGKLVIDHGTGNTASKKLHIIGETADGTDQDLFWSYKNAEGTLDAVNYKGKIENDFNLVNKGYVDAAVAGGPGGGIPVGCIMIWMNSTAPDGWFKLQGGSFDVNEYPQLHAYLQNTSGYSSGRLPSWGGYYPGEYGDHLTHSLGSKQGAKTAQPSAGAPRSSANIPNGTTRTFNATGGTNAYSAGASKVTIDENWDSTTRPKTVVVHYIIKHD